jgi:hypothetical protein
MPRTSPEGVTNMASQKIILPPSEMALRPNGKYERKNEQTIEERNFQVALIFIECYFSQQPPTGAKVATLSRENIKRTMEKSLSSPQVRYVITFEHQATSCHLTG